MSSRMGAARTAGRAPVPRPKAATSSKVEGADEVDQNGRLGSLIEWASGWGGIAARMILGVVFGYFAIQELLAPHLWTLYVPLINPSSALAVGAVEVHGWLLLMLAGSLLMGVLPRLAGAIGAVVMAEIVIALSVNGVNAIGMRDFGVLGLSLAVMAQRSTRWTISM